MKAHRGNASSNQASRHTTTGSRPAARKKSFAQPTPLRVIVLLTLGLAGSLVFDAISIPQASANSTKQNNNPPSRTRHSTISAGPSSSVDEFTLGHRVDGMARTTREIRALVDTLPGPGLTGARVVEPTPPYADPYEEMLVRLRHAATLVAETTAILRAMPNQVTPPAAASAIPVVPKALPLPVAPETQSLPALPNKQAQPGTAETVTANTMGVAKASPLSTTTLTRLAILILGALFAVGLIKYLPRLFRSKNGVKPLATHPLKKAIEPPPLTDHALELADIMSSMGLTDGAAHALVEHIRKNPKQALSYWLKLLAVYRQAGKQTEFEQTAEFMRTNYNIRPDSWAISTENHRDPASLEHYPHIAAQLKKLWRKPECSDYLLSLLADNRDGRREGFPLPVVEELVLLLAVLRANNDG